MTPLCMVAKSWQPHGKESRSAGCASWSVMFAFGGFTSWLSILRPLEPESKHDSIVHGSKRLATPEKASGSAGYASQSVVFAFGGVTPSWLSRFRPLEPGSKHDSIVHGSKRLTTPGKASGSAGYASQSVVFAFGGVTLSWLSMLWPWEPESKHDFIVHGSKNADNHLEKKVDPQDVRRKVWCSLSAASHHRDVACRDP
jgi:hypothetical protein